MHFETIAVHAGGELDQSTGAVAPPIHLSTTFARDEQGNLISGFSYVRDGNPTESRLESALAQLDGGDAALVFASGMAAGVALIQSLPAGSRIVMPDDGYYGYRLLARDFLGQWGYSSELVSMEDLDAVRRAIRGGNTLLWAESPSNPLMKIVDLNGLASVAREAGALFVVDGTFASPALQRPLDLGADIVMHATTKYLGGHSDVQGGALVFRGRSELVEKVRHARHLTGAVASPFNSWLVLRGLRSLAARMRVHCESASRVAEFLLTQPSISAVHYPGLPSHPRHDVARRQMSAFGGMVSFQMREGAEAAIALVGRTRLFTRATSLGGTESLIEHRATSEGAEGSSPKDLVRMSVGLEHSDDLIEDLKQAFGPGLRDP